VVTLIQRRNTKLVPCVFVVDLLSASEGDFDVTAFQRQLKASAFILFYEKNRDVSQAAVGEKRAANAVSLEHSYKKIANKKSS
jgi:hypothetical protein